MQRADDLRWLSERDIVDAVRRQTGDREARVTEWSCEPLVGGAGDGIGVWRLVGEGVIRGRPDQWRIVLKGWSTPGEDFAPTAFNWPLREVALYGSGVLADLPGGVTAPGCFGPFRREDGSSWAWLEDITSFSSRPASNDDYALLARCLGRFNGAYLNGSPLPEHPGLSQRWIHQWVEASGPALDHLKREAHHPLVRRAYPLSIIKDFRQLWERREILLTRVERSPRTFCHMDAFPRNAFIPRNVSDPQNVILIDWSFTGPGHLGEELVPLVMASAIFMDVEMEALDALQEMALVAYIEGLRDEGWQGEETVVRDTYLITSVLRGGPGASRVLLPLILNTESHAGVEMTAGHSMDDYLAHLEVLHTWFLDIVRERPDLFG